MDAIKLFAIGFGVAAAILGSIFLTGQTFGQRCAAAYDDPASAEECVHRLSAGGRVYIQSEEG